MFLRNLKLQAMWHYVARRCDRDDRDASITWTWVHLITIKCTCTKSDRRSRKWTSDARDLIALSAIVGRHLDTSESSDQDRTSDFCKIIGSCPTIIARSWQSIGLHRIGRSAIFAAISSIKQCSSLFVS